jgi:hypothetical protein
MSLMNRLATPAVVVLAVGLAPVVPASAASEVCIPQARVSTSATSSKATMKCAGGQEQRQGAGRKGGKSVKSACVWVPKPDYQAAPDQKAEGDGGHWYTKFCSFGDYNTLADLQAELGRADVMDTRQTDLIRRAGLEVRFFTTPPPAPRRTPQQVMASIVDDLPFPDTYLAVNPAATKQVINIPTWVWLTDDKGNYTPNRYEQKSKTIVLEGYALQWQIVPQLTITPGDGGTDQTCAAAGVPWTGATDDPAACTVIYDRAGSYTVSATVGWTVQWWLAGARQDDITGPTKAATRAVTVSEIQTVDR